jgi:hypothetical protein
MITVADIVSGDDEKHVGVDRQEAPFVVNLQDSATAKYVKLSCFR